jgi:hypothetical protein
LRFLQRQQAHLSCGSFFTFTWRFRDLLAESFGQCAGRGTKVASDGSRPRSGLSELQHPDGDVTRAEEAVCMHERCSRDPPVPGQVPAVRRRVAPRGDRADRRAEDASSPREVLADRPAAVPGLCEDAPERLPARRVRELTAAPDRERPKARRPVETSRLRELGKPVSTPPLIHEAEELADLPSGAAACGRARCRAGSGRRDVGGRRHRRGDERDTQNRLWNSIVNAQSPSPVRCAEFGGNRCRICAKSTPL